MTEKPTPETLSHAEWLRNRAASPYFALARSGLLDSANAIERLERERDALREENEELRGKLSVCHDLALRVRSMLDRDAT